ncbi:MAG: hypothetical protein REI94_18200 [Moraxellaceae bacterium]|nr:hypothetical protein [Moraxellaceae bacterium]
MKAAFRVVVPLAIAALLGTACTTGAWYAGVQRGAESECRRQPGSAAEECMARINRQSHQDYEKARTGG